MMSQGFNGLPPSLPPPSLSAPNGLMALAACDITATQDGVTEHSVFTFVGLTQKPGRFGLCNTVGTLGAVFQAGVCP